MPFVRQGRSLVVMIIALLLLGCTVSEDTAPAGQTPNTHQQDPSELIACLIGKVQMRCRHAPRWLRRPPSHPGSAGRVASLVVGGRAADRLQCRITNRQ